MNTSDKHTSSRRVRRASRNVLVIGGAGYIGSALLPRLLDHGFQVRLLDILLFGCNPIANLISHPRLEIIEADFRDVDRVVEAMQGMDVVVHLGAIVGDPACNLDERLTVDINIEATRMIAEIAKKNHANRFVFASTCSVYGTGNGILTEKSALNPISIYARSKLAAEKLLLRLASSTFHPMILRFGTLYGLSGRIRFDLVVNLLTAKAIKEGSITLSGGDQWRPFLHVRDAALGIFEVIDAPLDAVGEQIFNVGSNEQNYQIKQLGDLIQTVVPSAQTQINHSDSDLRDYRVHFNKFKQAVDFKPAWTVQRGIEQVVQAIRGGLVQDYRDSIYSNVESLIAGGASKLRLHPHGGMTDVRAPLSGNANDAPCKNLDFI